MPAVTFMIESDLAHVPLVGVSMRAVAALGFDEQTAALVELCVVEALTNIIKHAYGHEPGHPVAVTAHSEVSCLTIKVRDQGREMPPRVLETHRQALDYDPEDLDQVPESGMGLGIIQSVMDEVRYDRQDGHNILSMHLNRETDPTTGNGSPA